MATFGVGGGAGRRATNHELPLVPFIDFLLCCVTFLLATAAFSTLARLASTANVPGRSSEPPVPEPRRLHLTLRDRSFHLSWQAGATVLAASDLPLQAVDTERGGRRYPALAEFLDRDGQAHGAHRSADDAVLDEAVLHVRNSAPYEDVVAVLDALRSPQRATPGGARVGLRGQLRGGLRIPRTKTGICAVSLRRSHSFPAVLLTRHEWPLQMGNNQAQEGRN